MQMNTAVYVYVYIFCATSSILPICPTIHQEKSTKMIMAATWAQTQHSSPHLNTSCPAKMCLLALFEYVVGYVLIIHFVLHAATKKISFQLYTLGVWPAFIVCILWKWYTKYL